MKYAVCGNYGAGNIGDEMILHGLIKTIKTADPQAQIAVLSAAPEETKNLYNISSVPKFPAGLRSILKSLARKSSTKKEVKNADYFILGGGGLFASLKKRANIIWAVQALKAYSLKKPVIMYGQSIGKIKGPILKPLLLKIFQNSSLITVRDQTSKENLQEIGVTQEIHILPDLAFRNTIQKAEKQNIAVVSLREMGELPANMLKEIAEFLKYLQGIGLQIHLVDFQKEDNLPSNKLINLVPDAQYNPNLNLPEIENLFAKAKFVLGMRLHSIITAIKAGTPFIAINYSPKVMSLLKTANLNETVINPEDITQEKLKELFKKAPSTENLNNYNQLALEAHQNFEETTLSKLILSAPQTPQE